MKYDRGDSFPFYYEPNVIQFGPKSKGKLTLRSYCIQFKRKCKSMFLSIVAEDRVRVNEQVCYSLEAQFFL